MKPQKLEPYKNQVLMHLHSGHIIKILSLTAKTAIVQRIRCHLEDQTKRRIRIATLLRWWRPEEQVYSIPNPYDLAA
jgi:hypothetical protein